MTRFIPNHIKLILMKRQLCIFLLCFVCFIFLKGQDTSSDLVGIINGDYYIWEIRTQKYTRYHSLMRFDPSMKLITRSDLGISPSSEDEVELVSMIGNKIFLLTLNSATKRANQTLYYQEIDLSTLTKAGKKTVLFDSPPPAIKTKNIPSFNYAFSDDGSKILVVREYLKNLFKAKPQTFDISVFDANFNLQWKRSETLTLTDKEYKSFSYDVSNNGDVEIMGIVKYDKDTIKTKLLTDYLILDYTEKGQKFSNRNVALEIPDVKIVGDRIVHGDNEFIAAGFYKIPNARKQYGYFLQEYNLNNLSREKSYYRSLAAEQDENIENEADPDLGKINGKGGDDRFVFDVRKLRFDSNGNIFLIGEQHNTNIYYGKYGTVETDYYLDIYVLKLDPEGKLIWEIRIPKRQVYTPTASKNAKYLENFVSYSTCLLDDNLLFFINDNPENLNIGDNKPKKVRWKESQGQVIVVNKDGKMQRKLLSDIPGNMFYTRFLYILPHNRILIRYAAFKEYEESTYKIIDLDNVLNH